MSYTAKSNGDGTYTVFNNDTEVVGARVKQISFPSITSHRLEGTVHHISGPCVATISIPGASSETDVPVIF
jgi:hypothetical protein